MKPLAQSSARRVTPTPPIPADVLATMTICYERVCPELIKRREEEWHRELRELQEELDSRIRERARQ